MKAYVNGVLIELTDAEEAAYIASIPTDTEVLAQKWQNQREIRDDLLSRSDWVVTKASETGVAASDEWKTYRQALRDIPSTQSDPDNITWPDIPRPI